MKTTLIVGILSFISFFPVFAQEEMNTEKDEKKEMMEEKEPKAHFAVNFVHNSVAGFFPVFLGTFETKKKFDVTFYNILWTNATFGTPSTGGDMWLENGVGLGFHALDNELFINPSIGFTHGKFLSGSTHTKLFEGMVPNVLVIYNHKRFEFEGYFALYKAMRQGHGGQRDFILNWAYPGVKITKRISAGGYYEQFRLMRNETAANAPTGDIYQNVGGYIKFGFDNGINARIGLGVNLQTDLNSAGEFYKMNVFIPLH
ncbi:hypothetical protein N9F08_00950 [bacterium]|nr:hypothetical protein [bacterium]